MSSSDKCTFVNKPAVNQQCSEWPRWAVRYRVGSSRILVNEPFIRCSKHLLETIEFILADDDRMYMLESVERYAKPERQAVPK